MINVTTALARAMANKPRPQLDTVSVNLVAKMEAKEKMRELKETLEKVEMLRAAGMRPSVVVEAD